MKMIHVITLFFFVATHGSALAQDKAAKGAAQGNEKVIYKYKKFENFNFDDIDINGGGESVGDLSITPRKQRSFENKLPYRTNFNPEIRKSIETIR